MLEILLHIVICPIICYLFHLFSHRKSKHQEIDYDKLADVIISKVEKIELEKVNELDKKKLSDYISESDISNI